MPLSTILPGLNYPLIALPVECVIQRHPRIAVLHGELHRGPCRIALKGHGGDVHIHGRYIQAGLRLARIQVFDHGLADRVFVLDIFSRAGRQQQSKDQRRRERDSFHFIDYTCLLRFAV